jgi:hypothetical protein
MLSVTLSRADVTNLAKFGSKLLANHTHRSVELRVEQCAASTTASFDPPTLVVLEAAFDEAWLTLKSIGNTTVKPDELARSVLRLAMEGERDPVRLHDGALEGLNTGDRLARSKLIALIATRAGYVPNSGRLAAQAE